MEEVQLLYRGMIIDAQLDVYIGELMHIQVLTDRELPVGESVVCFYRHKKMDMTIIRVQDKRITLFSFHPPRFKKSQTKYHEERRKEERTKVNMKAVLFDEEDIIPVNIVDISLHGAGFTSTEPPLNSAKNYQMMIHYADLSILPEIQIQHQSDIPEGLHYGVQFVNLSEADQIKLRSFILFKDVNID